VKGGVLSEDTLTEEMISQDNYDDADDSSEESFRNDHKSCRIPMKAFDTSDDKI